jgi:hypothetical protein
MALFGRASSLIAALRSIRSKQRCFDLAARGRDSEALELLARTRAVTRNNPLASWDVELQLLEGYLLLELGKMRLAQAALRGVFNRIKRSRDYNQNERAVLIRYGVSVLWIARGRLEPSCLLRIRQSHSVNPKKVSGALLNYFPNPDEAPDCASAS